jgi:hypothetical protein
MLQGVLLISGEPDNEFISLLQSIRGVKWISLFTHREDPEEMLHDERIPENCTLVTVLDSAYTSFAYLSGLVRRGCHLFLTEKQKMTSDERMKLIHLAEEGNTMIQFRNDLLFHPSLASSGKYRPETKLIVLQHVEPDRHSLLQEMLYGNLLMILKIIDAEPARFTISSIPAAGGKADVIQLHLHFNNGSAASLTLSFTGKEKEHLLTVHSSTGKTTYNFSEKTLQSTDVKVDSGNAELFDYRLLFRQINQFTETISKKSCQRNVLSAETKTFNLIERINQKLELDTVLN